MSFTSGAPAWSLLVGALLSQGCRSSPVVEPLRDSPQRSRASTLPPAPSVGSAQRPAAPSPPLTPLLGRVFVPEAAKARARVTPSLYADTGGRFSITLASRRGAPLTIYTGRGVRVCHPGGAPCSQPSAEAAQELRRYLSRITGAEFDVRESDGSAQGTGIFVGTLDELPGLEATLAPSLPGAALPEDYDFTWREGYVVEAYARAPGAPGQLHLVGKTERGVAHAVSRLLEALGCRWLMPGTVWEVVPKSSTPSFDQVIVDRPALGLRQLSAQWSGVNVADANGWARHNRMTNFEGRGSSLAIDAGQGAWVRAIRQHQDWFEAGSREADARYGRLNARLGHFNPGYTPCTTDEQCVDAKKRRDPALFCGCMDTECSSKKCTFRTPEIGNAGVARKMAEHVTSALSNGTLDAASIEPGDGIYYASDAEENRQGTGSFADQMGWFANQVAASLQQAPDPKLHDKMVAYLAYANKAEPPSFPLSANVWVDVLFAPTRTYPSLEDALSAWTRALPGRVGIRDNLSYYQSSRDVWPGGWATYSPGRMNDSVYLTSFMRRLARHGVRSVKLETSFSWGLSGMGYYLFSKLAWDPDADVEALQSDVVNRTFGAAARAMRDYFLALDPRGQPLIVTKPRFGQAFGALDRADRLATNHPEVRARIRELKLWLHYQTLFWKLYRSASRTEQAEVALAICNLGYRARDSFMLTRTGATSIFAEAVARQFGVTPPATTPDPTWQPASPTARWKLPDTAPTAMEIDEWFRQDQSFFDTPSVPTHSFDEDLVPVTLAHPRATDKPPSFYAVHAPLRVATYSFDGTLAVHLQTAYTERPDVKVVIRGPDRRVVAETTIPADNKDHRLEPGPLAPQTLYFLDVDPATNGVRIFAPSGTPLVAAADQVYRLAQGGIDAAVYVPKGTRALSYVWTPQYDQFFNSQLGPAVVSPRSHRLYGPDGDAVSAGGSTEITMPNDIISIPVPTAARGKVWLLKDLWASQLWFYTVPPYYGAPSSLMVPRGVARADGLTIRDH